MRVSGIDPVVIRRVRIEVGQARQRLGQYPALDVRVAVGGELERFVPKYPLTDLQRETLGREPRPGCLAEAVKYQLEAVLVAPRKPGREQVGSHHLRDRLSAISAVTVSRKRRRLGLYFDNLDHNVKTDDFEAFVAHLRRRLSRPIILVMDRYSVHRAATKRLLARLGREVHIEWLPAYAPELNPDEQVWNRAAPWPLRFARHAASSGCFARFSNTPSCH